MLLCQEIFCLNFCLYILWNPLECCSEKRNDSSTVKVSWSGLTVYIVHAQYGKPSEKVANMQLVVECMSTVISTCCATVD